MVIRSKEDYIRLIDKLKKEANEVNGTYEFIGEKCFIIGTTEYVRDLFDIDEDFSREFIKSIATFEKKEIGPYITEKYFLLIPALKEAIMQLKNDCAETRRCVITFPSEHCFQSIQFLIRENTVHVICYMRSCNVIKNLPHDILICSIMADIFSKYVKDLLGIEVYEHHSISMLFGSLHVFKEDL